MNIYKQTIKTNITHFHIFSQFFFLLLFNIVPRNYLLFLFFKNIKIKTILSIYKLLNGREIVPDNFFSKIKTLL